MSRVGAEYPAARFHDLAGPLARIAVAREETLPRRPGEEAEVLTLALVRDRQPRRAGELPHLRLGQLAEREPHPRQRAWVEAGQHVRLVLSSIGGAREQRPVPVVVDAGVVAGDER